MNITASERVVMRILWSKPNIEIDEIMSELPSCHTWSKSTVKTLLARLVHKGFLKTQGKKGRANLYMAAISEDQAVNDISRKVLDEVCAMKQSQLLSNLICKAQLTQSDIVSLQSLLSSLTPIAEKHCDCLKSKASCHC